MKTKAMLTWTNKSVLTCVICIAVACFTCATGHGQETLQITFDGPPSQPLGTARAITNYSESGMLFTQRFAHGTNVIPVIQFTRNGGGISGYPDDGSAFLQAGSPVSWLVCQFTNGSIFNLLSADLAEYSTVFQEPLTVHFIGYRPDGSTVALDQTTDGIIDGTGPLGDFQTFVFPGFTGLSRLEISTADASCSLDNLIIEFSQPDEPVIGEVVAWGSNTLKQTNVPPNLTNIIAIAAGSVQSVALRSDGTVCAWGTSNFGETNVPPGLSNVVSIAAAGFYGNKYGHCLALKSDGTVTEWGSVKQPAGLSNVVAIAAGAYWWMALKSDGTVASDYSFLKDGQLVYDGNILSNVVAIASGGRHCLALNRNGTVVGWGLNNYGQATGVPTNLIYGINGNLVTINHQVLSNVVSIAAGDTHSVALKSDGTVVVWGNDQYGQTNVPVGLSNVVAIAKGGNEAANQVLALQADGNLVAWGGSNAQTNMPAGLTNVVAAAVGSAHSLALIGAKPLVAQVRLSAPTWNGNTFSVSLPTQSGRVYSLEYKIMLGDADWTPTTLVAGNGHLLTLTDSNAVSSSKFYRVRQW